MLDADGRSLVPTIGLGRDAFFNQSESQPFLAARGVRFAAGMVSVDVAHLAPQTVGTLTVRLVNNDGDTNSTVRVRTTVPHSALWGVDESGTEQTAVLFRYTNDPAGADPGFESFGRIVYRDACSGSGFGGALIDVGRGVEALAINAEGTAYLALNRDLAGTQGPVLLSVDLNHALFLEGGAIGAFNVEARIVGPIGVASTGVEAITGLAWHERTDMLYGFYQSLEGFVNGGFERVLNGEALSFDSDGALLVSDVFVTEGHDNTRARPFQPEIDDPADRALDGAAADRQTLPTQGLISHPVYVPMKKPRRTAPPKKPNLRNTGCSLKRPVVPSPINAHHAFFRPSAVRCRRFCPTSIESSGRTSCGTSQQGERWDRTQTGR